MHTQSSARAPVTTFPLSRSRQSEVSNSASSIAPLKSIDDEIISLLINSDSQECNENLSIYFKFIIDNIYMDRYAGYKADCSYHNISKYAMKLLSLNLFVKNYSFCVGKMLAFMSAFNSMTDISESCLEIKKSESKSQDIQVDYEYNEKVRYESECFKEFLCIILLLLLKMSNTDQKGLESIDKEGLFEALRDYGFVSIMSNFIANHVIASNNGKSLFVLLKFSCDIFFEYLYKIELLSTDEFVAMTEESPLVTTLIEYLLSNGSFNNYDIDGDDFEDEDKLIAYEEFKLLLLINEQYLMKNYASSGMKNKVFDGLMCQNADRTRNHANISGFINLLIYYLNREESQIINILILKFLYLVFTTSYTTSLIYLNDLKILVDIFIRELNNLDYTTDYQSSILLVTYLKVMHPLLLFSELKELQYKKNEIVDTLRNIVLHSTNSDNAEDAQKETAGKLALKCMSINWLKQHSASPTVSKLNLHKNTSSSSLTEAKKRDARERLSYSPSLLKSTLGLNNRSMSSLTDLQPKNSQLGALYDEDGSSSNDSLGAFTRVASVRSFSRVDFYKHTTQQNKRQSMYKDHAKKLLTIQDNNAFLKDVHNISLKENLAEASPVLTPSELQNMLDLPTDYLNAKPLPMLPERPSVASPRPTLNSSANSSTNSVSLLVMKALKKKAPPPPPRKTGSCLESSDTPIGNSLPGSKPHGKVSTPPPPPPPRRRR